MKIIDPILTCQELEVDLKIEGSYVMYTHIKTPVFTSNRCSFEAVHTLDEGENVNVSLSTSEGLEDVEAAEKARIGKDVLAKTKFAYSKYEGCQDGVVLTTVVCVDPAGSLPDFIKLQIAKQNSEGAERMVKHLLKKLKGV